MRVLIVDDEAGARAKVKRFLSAHEDCLLCGEAENGREAVVQICTEKPDLVYLDINMPELDGFQALASLPEQQRPYIIFATAYDDRAVKAFEVSAVDYLLKPFDRARFDASLERVRRLLANKTEEPLQQQMMQVLSQLRPQASYPRQLLVQDGSHVTVVDVDNIYFVESAANYAVLHCHKLKHIMRTSMAALEEKLDPKNFCRVHRSYIVNIKAIKEIKPFSKGDMTLLLNTGAELRLSRRYKDQLFAVMSA